MQQQTIDFTPVEKPKPKQKTAHLDRRKEGLRLLAEFARECAEAAATGATALGDGTPFEADFAMRQDEDFGAVFTWTRDGATEWDLKDDRPLAMEDQR